MNVIFMFTRYSVIFPPSIRSFCSWIQAPFTFWSVLFARSMPIRVASSKLLVDAAVISVTLATDMARAPSVSWGTMGESPQPAWIGCRRWKCLGRYCRGPSYGHHHACPSIARAPPPQHVQLPWRVTAFLSPGSRGREGPEHEIKGSRIGVRAGGPHSR